MSNYSNGTSELTVHDLARLGPFLLCLAGRTLSADVGKRVSPSDIVQQTYLEAFRDFQGFRGATDQELQAWLRTILLNNTRNAARRVHTAKRDITRERSVRSESLPYRDAKTPSSIVASHEEFLRLQSALQELPLVYRDAIEYRSLQQCTFAQVGEKLGKTEEAARKTWFRAIKLLRTQMDASA